MERYHSRKQQLRLDDFDDNELIQAYLGGSQEAFAVLYGRYKRQLYSYLGRLCGTGSGISADDIFQQTWLKIIDKLPGYRCKQKFLAWAFRIAHNLMVDHFRKIRRKAEVAEEEHLQHLKTEKEPWSAMDQRELSLALDRALEELAPELREVFLLRMEQVSFKEIADIQGCSINTALGRMQYAMKNLRRVINETEYGGG